MRDKQIATYLETSTAFVTGTVLSPKPREQFVNLSEVLETGPIPERFFLTQKACAGILRRAAKRGKDLPEPLHRALAAVSERKTPPTGT